MTLLDLTPGATGLDALEKIYRDGCAVKINRSAEAGIRRSAEKVAQAAQGDAAVYGVNTGFGKLASVKIVPEDTETLQRNLILSHCCGVGEPLDKARTRLMMALKLLSLGRGASGVRFEVLELIEACLAKGVTPVVPSQGSVGASGDLAPLAHMAAVLIGEGQAEFDGKVLLRCASAGRGWSCACSPRPQGRPRADQRHPVFDRLRFGRSV